jgi:hypothetical protein
MTTGWAKKEPGEENPCCHPDDRKDLRFSDGCEEGERDSS